MDNNNSFDWAAVQLTNGNQNFGTLSAMGIDPSKTTLESRDFYKGKEKIKEQFKTADGKFDDAKFNTFYGNLVKSYNDFKKSDGSIANATTDLYSDDSITRGLGMPIRKTPVSVSLVSKDPFTNLKNARNSFFGLTEINKWSAPTKSLAEVAQSQKVTDFLSGKPMDYTPEDTGLFNLYGFLQEPLVLAAYDTDVRDAKGKIIHKKGEYKFNAEGLPFYETLAGRDVAGKQVLSRGDTLTKEGSFMNKFDFMDSDGMEKSITGTLVKSAVQIAPFVIGGPLGTAYTAYYIASGLTDASAEILKTVDGLMNGPNAKNDSLYKWANSLQGYTAQWKSGTSDHGKDNFFSLESLLGQAVDSVYQLKSQKAIVEWPLEFTKFQMAKKLGVEAEGALAVGKAATESLYNIETYAAKYGSDWIKSAQALSKNVEKLHKYETYGQHISRAYMAATSAVGITQAAKEAGIDARDQGFLYLGYTAALYKLFGAEYAHFVEKRIGGLDDFAKSANKMLSETGKEILPTIKKEVEDAISNQTKPGKILGMIATGKKLAESVFKRVNELDARTAMGAMAKEGFEEMTEQSIQNALQVVYNGFNAAGLTSTQDKNVGFNTDPIEMAKNIAMNGIGGMLGGFIFHHVDPSQRNNFRSEKLMDYVIEGYSSQVQERIKDMKAKGQFGETSLSIVPLKDENGIAIQGVYEPVSPQNPVSQNDFIADNLSKSVTVLEELKKQFNILNPAVTAENKAKFYENLVDPGTDTDLRQRLNKTITDIFNKSAEIQSISGTDVETNEGMLAKKAELKALEKELEYLQSDESIDEFFTQGLFNVRTDINTAFGVKNRETIAMDIAKKPYKQLTESQKVKVDEAYQEYVNTTDETGLQGSLKKANKEYKHFNEVMEKKGYYKEIDTFKESMEHLKKYIVSQPLPYIPEGEDAPVAVGETYRFTQDYMTKLAGVKYIPDYIFDQVKRGIGDVASAESEQLLNALSTNPVALKAKVNKALKGDLSNGLVREYVKALVGDKVFDEIINSNEYKDVQDNAAPLSNYSTLKLLKDLSQLQSTVNLGKVAEQRQLIENLSQLDFYEVQDKLYEYNNEEIDKNDPILSLYAGIDGLFDYVDTLREEGFADDSWGELFTTEGLTKFVMTNHLEKSLNRELTQVERDGLYQNFDLNNIYVRMLTEGKYSLGNEELESHTLNNLQDDSIRQSMQLLGDFDKERVPSPLRETSMKDVYAILDSEMENLNTVGVSNYLNADESFSSMLEVQLTAIDRVSALVNAAATMNPIINDFRFNHKGIIGDENKDTVLSILEVDDEQTLQSELGRAYKQLKYLKDVNEFNKNNVLTRLLREDGYELVSKVHSLREISEDPEVLELVPSLHRLSTDAVINKYVETYKVASEEDKQAALPLMAKLEDDIYKDVQNLTQAQKVQLVNKTFTPIYTSAKEFYDPIDPTKPLNHSHRTIYLATIFGASTTDFYARYVGVYDVEQEAFTNLNKSPYIPFAKQESAVRVSNLMINGDRSIVKMLLNAYSYEIQESEVDTIDYSKPADNGLDNSYLISILGSPGTGKTTAVLSNVMNMVDDTASNTVVLAPKTRQFESLHSALVKTGFEERIDDRSGTVRSFLQNLGLRNKDGSNFEFSTNDEAINYKDASPTTKALRENFKKQLELGSLSDPTAGVLANLDLTIGEGKSTRINPKITNLLNKTKLIVIDEFTHVNPIDIAILQRIVQLYNESADVRKNPAKAVFTITLGDNNQLGFLNGKGHRRDYTDVSNTIVTQPLLTSLRSGWDLINNTLVDVARRTVDIKTISTTNPDALTSTEVIQNFKNNAIKLFTYKGDDGNIGMQSIKVTDGPKVADIAFISENKNTLVPVKDGETRPLGGKDIVYVVNSADDVTRAQALLREAFGENWSEYANIEVYTPDEVQGGEYRYAIIDAQPNLAGNQYDITRVHEFLNTMLSRATEGTLLLDNGSMDPFVTFENNSKERAIRQTKITDDVINNVKKNKQVVMAAILGSDYVPEGAKPGSLTEVDTSRVREIPVKPLNKILFNDPKPEVSEISAKVSNITAYTTFNTKLDFEKIRKLPTTELGITDDKIENIIQSLKYYLIKGDEIGEGNVALYGNFRDYLKGYDYDSPQFYLELAKREGDNILYGRSELHPVSPAKELFTLKVSLRSESGAEPLDLTLGTLVSLENLMKKYTAAKSLDASDKKVGAFVNQLSNLISGTAKTVDWGTVEDGKWKSRKFSKREFKEMSTIWGSRLKYDTDGNMSLNQLKKLYPDFHITDPQVIVAQLTDANTNENIFDKDGTNPEYRQYWNDLKGKSVVFISEYKELQNLTSDQLLEVYMKQIALFNTPEFRAADAAGKKAIIDSVQERIEIDRGRFSLPYKPGMVKMIRLNNPKASFINFRESFLTSIASVGKGTPLKELFEKFDMTPYVKDRLLKSLLTIRQFLKDGKENQEWFKNNVMPKLEKMSAERIADIRQQALERFGETGDFDQDYSKHDSFDEVVLDTLGPITSVEDFLKQLDATLDLNSESNIYREKWDTVEDPNSSARPETKKSSPVTEDDLKLALTTNKQADFSKSIIDLNLLNLFKKTKNLNFAELIDESIKTFANLPKDDKRFDRYRLESVFKDGQIEIMTVANKASVKGNNADNVLADVKYAGNTFTFGFKGIQQPAYDIQFDKLLDSMSVESQPKTQEEVNALYDQIAPRISDLLGTKIPVEWLEQKFASRGLDSADPNYELSITEDLNDQFDKLLTYEDVLNRLNETVRVPVEGQLMLDSTVAYQVSPNGIVAEHTVESDVKKNLIDNFTDFKKLTVDDIELTPVGDAENDRISFTVEIPEGEFKVTYILGDRTVDVKRLQVMTDEEFRQEFEDSVGDTGEKDPQKILDTVSDLLGKQFLKGDARPISTVDGLKLELGRKFDEVLSDTQVNILVNGKRAEGDEFYTQLTDAFLKRFMEPEEADKFLQGILEVAIDTIQYRTATMLDTGNTPEPDIDMPTIKLKEAKPTMTKMDKLKQDVRDANDKAKREFEYKVRELFAGAQNEKEISGLIDMYAKLYRAAILNQTVANSDQNTSLADLGVADDIAEVDEVKLTSELMMQIQALPKEVWQKYKPLFATLNKYKIEKTKQDC